MDEKEKNRDKMSNEMKGVKKRKMSENISREKEKTKILRIILKITKPNNIQI